MTLIIAPSGKIGSGKNFIAETIIFHKLREKNLNVAMIAFADYLKILCYTKDKIPYEKLFHDKDLNSRRTLQLRGEDERRDNPNIFVDFVDCQTRIMSERGIDVTIVLDARYKNEAKFLKNKGAKIIRFNSPNRTYDKMVKECNGDEEKIKLVSSHTSEIDLDDYQHFDYVVNNDYENETNVENEVYNILNSIIQ